MPDPQQIPPLLWQPDDKTLRNCHLRKYMDWLREERNLDFPDYDSLWRWSVSDVGSFWDSIAAYFNVQWYEKPQAVLEAGAMPDFSWFSGGALNYAAHVFRQKSGTRPAILYQDERNALTEMSWEELERQTAALAQWMQTKGIKRGDRVVAYLPNTPHAIVSVLACMSLGAVWSSCSPDFGAASVADRFAQIEPKLLIAADGYSYGGKVFDKTAVVEQLCQLLPTVECLLFAPLIRSKEALPAVRPEIAVWDAVTGLQNPSPLHFEALPFNHPLWVLYSSGTTGNPKAITHSHGGNLLEHLKYVHLHNDVHPGERFFWYSTTGWMMWNFTLSTLLAGATIVLYDGSPGYPDLNVLWELAERADIQHFGTSAPFLVSCMKAGTEPGKRFDLSGLRSIGSTGSPLPPDAFSWVYTHVKSALWLSSMAGGTDVCTAWVGGNPMLPVYQGEIQCRCLGAAMESWDEAGHPVATGEVGEMVVTLPMPSMPVFFWNDPDKRLYRQAYFEHYPGVWRHGDWLQITARKGLVILGRSDATLNRQGVRIGTAEIYRALDHIPAVKDSLIVNLEYADGTDWMPLFVALQEGELLTDDLKKQISASLRTTYSPRHVPDSIIAVEDIPYTISGKKMETPVKKILQGKDPAKVYSPDAMRNPSSMKFFIDFAPEANKKR